MLEKTAFVIYLGKRWGFRKVHARRFSRLFDTRAQAIRYGKAIVKRDGWVLSIHREDGTPHSEVQPGKAVKKAKSRALRH